MRKRIVQMIFTIVSIFAHIAAAAGGLLGRSTITVLAVGDLTVNWGVPEGDPIFVVANMKPGDSETRNVTITNDAATNRPVGVRGVNTSETGNLSEALDFTVSANGTDLYGGTSGSGSKTLQQFFDETQAIDDGIELFMLAPGESRTVTFRAEFLKASGNEFQGAEVVFNLIIGISIDLPPECSDQAFDGEPIFGTDGNDNITGTTGDDLIITFEGDDSVNAKDGDDCIVAGPGNDNVNGENNDDILFGEEGNDNLNGGKDSDRLLGGEGDDILNGKNGDDYLEGNIGDDELFGGNSDDMLKGGEGNDLLKG